MINRENLFMDKAISEAYRGVINRDGGPFGSVIVKNGEIVGVGHNTVIKDKDPTCHGEINAIRDACKNLKSFDLSHCELYTTAEPCPMCYYACRWANIEKVYYGCSVKDTEMIGFRDNFFKTDYGDELPLIQYHREDCLTLFEVYDASSHEMY